MSRIKIISLSGPSSSGKSTVARLLKSILPGAILVYQDDFYKPDDEIPRTAKGLANWDCPEAFDMELLSQVMADIHATGETPSRYVSKEEKNELGNVSVPKAVEDELRRKIELRLAAGANPHTQFVLLDGIMLYQKGSAALSQFDIKLLLRAPREVLKQRRAARAGYVTLEGFWQDPPGYFDDVVWPSYVEYMSYLFENGDVDGPLSREAESLDIAMPPDVSSDLAAVLEWSVASILERLD